MPARLQQGKRALRKSPRRTTSKAGAARLDGVDAVLAGVSADKRAALEKLRRTIQAAAPGAEECLSYGLPAFRLNGRSLVAFGAWSNHCAFYPMSSATVKRFQARLHDFETTKGTIRFSPDKPLPAALVKAMVRARVAENDARNSRK